MAQPRPDAEREPPPAPRGGGDPLDLRPSAPTDPILASPWTRDEMIEDRIGWWLDFWQTRSKAAFQRALTRMGRYEDFVDAELAARGLPPSLRYLPIIEAGYFPTAVSPAGAAGLWQFMPATARWLGLEVNSLVDQRFDPYAATPHALDYLSRLQGQFGSWFLTLAAYNSGPGRVERVIGEHGDGEPRDDALFRKIRDKLPAETRDFIPKYLAAVRVASDPASFGLADFVKDPPQTYDVVTVDGAASIDVIATAAGATEDEVRLLNPHLVLRLTPARKSTQVRLPEGSGQAFHGRFAAVPAGDRVTHTRHRVASGETLSHIARNYRVSVAELEAANPAVEPRRLQIGAVLVIPRGVSRPVAQEANGEQDTANPVPARESVHVVVRGESLWLIARLYNVGLERLRAYNGLGEDVLIRPGDELRIPPPGG